MILKPNRWARVTSATWSLRQKPANLLFGLLLILLPTQIGLHFWPNWALVSGLRVDYYSPTIFLTDLLVLLLAVIWLPGQKINFKKHQLLLAGLAGFIILNTFFSINKFVTVYKWLKLVEFAFVAFYVFQNRGVIKKEISKYLVIALGYTVILALAEILLSRTIGGPFYYLGERTFNSITPGIALVHVFDQNLLRPYATFPHPNVLAGFGLVSFFIILTFENNKIIKLVGGALSGVLVLLSFSQGALLALLICLGLLVSGFYRHLNQIYKQIVFGLVIVSLVLMPVGQAIIENGKTLPEPVGRRLELSTIAGEAFADSPLIGVGEGSFISFIPRSLVQRNLWFLQPVHNVFLLVLAETGAVGLVVFILLLSRLSGRQNHRDYLVILAILLTGMFDHYFLTLQQTQLLFAIVIGILFDNAKNLKD